MCVCMCVCVGSGGIVAVVVGFVVNAQQGFAIEKVGLSKRYV